jgi:ubiquinone/menaquinone biosynthesis C-methylase UbiE
MTISLETTRPDDYLVRLAASDLGRAYKALVLQELRVPRGSVVVDLGCGPGADLRAFADAVGPTGRVLGVDTDVAALATAGERVSDLPWVQLAEADVHHLELDDASVDRIHTDRVLQHVADPAAVVVEAARVLRPRGVAAFAEPDWETLVVDHPEASLPVAYRRFVTERVVRNAGVGRRLPQLCEDAGLSVARVVPVTAVFRELAEADRLLGFERVTRRALGAGYLTEHQAASWLDHLGAGPVFASVTLFVTVAEQT